MKQNFALTVYHRLGCHLCDEMVALLSEYQDELNFTMQLVDIDEDAALKARFHVDIPVVAFGEQILFGTSLTRSEFEASITAWVRRIRISQFFDYCAYWPR